MRFLTNKFILIASFIVFFHCFSLTPLQFVEDLTKFVFLLLAFVCFILYSKHINKKLLKWSVLCTGFFFTAVVVSSLVLKQTITDSIIANIFLLLPVGNVFFYFWNYKKTEQFFVELEWAFSFVFWLDLVVVLYFSIFNTTIISYSIYTNRKIILESAFVPKALLEFGTFYFFAKAFYYKKPKYFFYAFLSIITFHLADIQRVVLVSTLIVMALMVLIIANLETRVHVFLAVCIIFLFFFLIINQFIELSIVNKFSEAFKFFSDKKSIEDISVLARVYEMNYGWEHFLSHPIFGNGISRGSSKLELLNGYYFYVADIGIVGILYAFGIAGFVFFIYQIKTTYNYFIKVKHFHNPFCQAIIFYLIYLFLKSISTVSYILDLPLYIFCISILILYETIENNEGR